MISSYCFIVNWEKYYISVIGKGPVAKLGRTSTDWERVQLPDPAKEGKKMLVKHSQRD